MLSGELRERAHEIIGRYPGARSALLPLLHLVQVQDGHVSDDGVAECAELLGLTKAEVAGVATFYTMLKREPMGRHLVSVCTNFSCKVRGGQEVFDRLSEHLGVGHDGTTPGGELTLEHAECLGNCEGAPVVTIDYYNYECTDADRAVELVDGLMRGEDPPPPTRGYVPTGIRDVEYRLAGLGPRDPEAMGVAITHARASDGAVPQPESGPGARRATLVPAFSDEDMAEREQAKRHAREAGYDESAVQREGGPDVREFPTTDPGGSQTDEGGS